MRGKGARMFEKQQQRMKKFTTQTDLCSPIEDCDLEENGSKNKQRSEMSFNLVT